MYKIKKREVFTMSKKETFMQEIMAAIDDGTLQLSEDGMNYFASLKTEKPKTVITDNGKIVLKFLQEQNGEAVAAIKIGEAVGMTGRTVSGTMRKLISDGFVAKLGDKETGITYQATADKGMVFELN